MLNIAMICLLAATVIFVVAGCFIAKNSPLSYLLKVFALTSLIALGLIAANSKTNFGGYTIFALISIIPMFLSCFDLKKYLETKRPTDNKSHKFVESNGTLLISASILLSSLALSVCGAYIGFETLFVYLIGIAIGFAIAFLVLTIKKQLNTFDFLSYLVCFIGVGVLIGQIISTLMFSFALSYLLFSIGLLLIATYATLKMFINSRFIEPIYFAGMILVLTLIIL